MEEEKYNCNVRVNVRKDEFGSYISLDDLSSVIDTDLCHSYEIENCHDGGLSVAFRDKDGCTVTPYPTIRPEVIKSGLVDIFNDLKGGDLDDSDCYNIAHILALMSEIESETNSESRTQKISSHIHFSKDLILLISGNKK
jgi:hypothetical protein